MATVKIRNDDRNKPLDKPNMNIFLGANLQLEVRHGEVFKFWQFLCLKYGFIGSIDMNVFLKKIAYKKSSVFERKTG